MDAIDSPLEALVFNYASFGFFTLVNNLWTWLALLTASLSLWKICARPHLPPPPPPPPSNDRSLSGSRSDEPERPVENLVLHEAPVTSEPAMSVFSAGNGDVDGVSRGKFTVYYEDDNECESVEELKGTSEECCDGNCGFESEWWEKWDKMLKKRTEVSGWYMYQDLTDLNGNVVKFWDSGTGNSRFPKEVTTNNSSCMVW